MHSHHQRLACSPGPLGQTEAGGCPECIFPDPLPSRERSRVSTALLVRIPPSHRQVAVSSKSLYRGASSAVLCEAKRQVAAALLGRDHCELTVGQHGEPVSTGFAVRCPWSLLFCGPKCVEICVAEPESQMHSSSSQLIPVRLGRPLDGLFD